jgi:predicted ATPase
MPNLQSVSLRNLSDEQDFPFTLPLIKGLEPLIFKKNITFFVGENGVGKSTILEALAYKLNLPVAGTASVELDPSLENARKLGKYLSIQQATKSSRGFFFRAEDFIGFVKSIKRQITELSSEITEIEETWTSGDINLATKYIKKERQELINRYGEDLDAMSHGEGFLKFFIQE